MNEFYTTIENNVLFVWLVGDESEAFDSFVLSNDYCFKDAKKYGWILEDGSFYNLRPNK